MIRRRIWISNFEKLAAATELYTIRSRATRNAFFCTQCALRSTQLHLNSIWAELWIRNSLQSRSACFDKKEMRPGRSITSWSGIFAERTTETWMNPDKSATYPPQNVVSDDYLVYKVCISRMTGTARFARWPLNFKPKGYINDDLLGTGRATKIKEGDTWCYQMSRLAQVYWWENCANCDRWRS